MPHYKLSFVTMTVSHLHFCCEAFIFSGMVLLLMSPAVFFFFVSRLRRMLTSIFFYIRLG